MKCDEAALLVHALIDGELDAGHAHEVEVHAKACARCGAELAAAQETRSALAGHKLSFVAPQALRSRIERKTPAPQQARSRRAVLKGFVVGSAVSALAASTIGVVILRHDDDNRLLGEAISAHLRSLQADHLTDVLSTDQHTVKPWFNGRIDLAPPVVDLAGQGFTLVGGRLDFIDGKPVAALVYRRRVHIINLFIAQRLGFSNASPKLEAVQGFNVLRWNELGLDFLAISDLNREELQEFGGKYALGIKAAVAG